MNSAFVRIVSGERHTRVLQLKMNAGVEFKWGNEYTYLEIPVGEIVRKSGNIYEIRAACTIEPLVAHGFKYMIEPNSVAGITSSPELLHGGEGLTTPSYFVSAVGGAGKSGELPEILTTLKWAVRIYILS